MKFKIPSQRYHTKDVLIISIFCRVDNKIPYRFKDKLEIYFHGTYLYLPKREHKLFLIAFSYNYITILTVQHSWQQYAFNLCFPLKVSSKWNYGHTFPLTLTFLAQFLAHETCVILIEYNIYSIHCTQCKTIKNLNLISIGKQIKHLK